MIWEGRWDAGFGGELGNLRQHKAFQLSNSSTNDERRIEIRTRFDRASGSDIAIVDARGYVWDPQGAPLPGQTNSFTIKPETWTRFFTMIDFDRRRFYMWISDENRGPIQIFDGLQFSDMSGGIDNFWYEFNTSQKPPGTPGRVNIWGRNFAALKDVADIDELLTLGSPERPNPPSNVRAD